MYFKYELNLQDKTGKIIANIGLDSRIFSHPFYDLSILHLNKEKETLYTIKHKLNYEIQPYEINYDPIPTNQDLKAIGYLIGKEPTNNHNRPFSVYIYI